ncbi:MAG: Phosphatidylglycerophosphatase A [Verrucomicrobia subdivision 3 bacterium]|nr:Phosphatidylglycerophosphatase A [Limisphaerales bacterium]MCS1417011.1 Phosphatidylglycerophosphatase A [Limisphaerales bacterium]
MALGGGVGRLPKAPGTYGSVLGMLWLAALAMIPNFGLVLGIIGSSLLLGVWLCTQAESILKSHDPGPIVIDEILAVPVAGLSWMMWPQGQAGGNDLVWFLLIFGLFRFFDITKPWPVGLSQRLPQGWGVMADDVLAGGYVAVITGLGAWGLSL